MIYFSIKTGKLVRNGSHGELLKNFSNSSNTSTNLVFRTNLFLKCPRLSDSLYVAIVCSYFSSLVVLNICGRFCCCINTPPDIFASRIKTYKRINIRFSCEWCKVALIFLYNLASFRRLVYSSFRSFPWEMASRKINISNLARIIFWNFWKNRKITMNQNRKKYTFLFF